MVLVLKALIVSIIVALSLACSAAAAPVRLYVYAEGNLRNASFLPVLMNWTLRAKECGYDGMFYADSDARYQVHHFTCVTSRAVRR